MYKNPFDIIDPPEGQMASPQGAAPATAPPLTQVVAPQAKDATPQTPEQRQNTQFQSQHTAAETAKLVAEANAGFPEIQTQKQALEDTTAKLNAASHQLMAVHGLYNAGFKDPGIFSRIGEMLPDWLSPGNQEFDSAGAGLTNVMMPIIRTPGQGSQSNFEDIQFMKANQPSHSDFDPTIEAKLGLIGDRLNQERLAHGLHPIDWTAPAPAPPGSGDHVMRTNPIIADPSLTQQQAVSHDGTRSVDDPAMKAIGLHLGRLLASGAPDDQISSWLSSVYQAPNNLSEALAWRKTPQFAAWKQANPHTIYPIEPSFWQKRVPLTSDQALTNFIGDSAYGAGAVGIAKGVTANQLANIADATGHNGNQARASQELLAAEHPYADLAGQAVGQAVDEYTLGRIPGAHALMNAKWGRRALDAVYGGAYGAGDNPDDPLSGAFVGAAGNLIGGGAGRNAQRSIGHALSGVADEGLHYLDEKGVPLTIGSIARSSNTPLGKAAAWTEDRLAGLPGPDALINLARRRGAVGFNEAMFNDAAAPAGRAITDIGEHGSEQLQTAIGDAYSKALDGVTLARDKPFAQQWSGLVARGSREPRIGGDISSIAGQVQSLFDKQGQLSGKGYQEALQILRTNKAEWEGQPGADRMSKAIDGLENSLTDLVQRQRPDVVPALQQANEVYRNTQIVRRALRSGAAQRNDSLISPTQLNTASIANTRQFGGDALATSTGRPFFRLAKEGVNVLPGEIPDSGTAGRQMVVPLLGGLLAAGGEGLSGASGDGTTGGEIGNTGRNLGLLTLLASAPYSKVGQKVIQKTLLSERHPMVDYVGKLLQQYPWLAGTIGGAAERRGLLSRTEPNQP